jgi:hypothetical protein
MTNRPSTTVAKTRTTQVDPAEPQLKSPFIPLLWLLIPFIGCIIYGVLTSPRLMH